ncbi:hypothetical protein SISNIDRAFT_458776 [Sistotremastrum niveocremeum HHB9708]|uniref:F-box domain-containing protein n=1 Tax=Sistotremastrum niveocremeum HHB9708 TaxID=1314777 RepID=A0A164Q3M2_9AGAM|nr:hypothetical protein SISNIDRAFT_458776 [Sistotremastrum niveocremeum HHB9708]
MLLDELPAETLRDIMKHCVEDNLALSPKQRLKAALRLGTINRRLRDISLTCPEVWCTIHLEWKQDVVVLFLQRAKQSAKDPPLFIHLDTNGCQIKTLNARIDDWVFFFKKNMKFVKTLNIVIFHSNPALAVAFNVAAPLLQSCSITVGSKIRLATTLFSKQAPQLAIARFRSTSHFDFGHASSLRVLNLEIDQQNAKGFLNAMEATPGIESLTLKGAQNPLPLPLHLRGRRPLVLSQCRSLTIVHMPRMSARQLMSLLRLPSLVTLDYQEIQDFEPSESEITMASALTFMTEFSSTLPNPTLSIDILPYQIVVRLTATPFCFCFTSDWSGLPYLALPDQTTSLRIFAELEDLLTCSASCFIQPEQFIFSYNLIDTKHLCSVLFFALRNDFQTLLARMFRAYPSIQSLQLHQVQHPARALLDDLQILPQLSSVEFRSGNSLISPETWQLLQDIQEVRGVSIHMKMP